MLTSKRTQAKNRIKKKLLDEQRLLVFQRCKGFCEAKLDGCFGVASHAHHKKMKSQGGKDEVDNLLGVCAKCHRMIHDNPKDSYEKGHLIR